MKGSPVRVRASASAYFAKHPANGACLRAMGFSADGHGWTPEAVCDRQMRNGCGIDSRSQRREFADAAASVLEEGVALARDAGLEAFGEAIESGSGAWRALAEAAGDHQASVIVAGSRGL